MKNKIYVVVIAIITIILLVISFLFAINYKKESENYFYESGYILSNNYESGSENVSKLYFDAETSYKNNKKDEYTFKNSEGEKVKVSEDSFVHYSNGSIMSLKKGVAIDLDEIDAKLINYYNVFEGSVLTKKNEVYEIDNLDKKIMKKIFSLFLILGSLTFITSSCVSKKNVLSLSSIDGEWKIEAIKGKSAIGNQDVAPFIGFDINDNRIYGNVGCNSVNGELVQEASVPTSLSFKNVACTQMLCPDMETEQAVLESLNATRSFTKGLNGNIILLDADGAEVLVLSKR